MDLKLVHVTSVKGDVDWQIKPLKKRSLLLSLDKKAHLDDICIFYSNRSCRAMSVTCKKNQTKTKQKNNPKQTQQNRKFRR